MFLSKRSATKEEIADEELRKGYLIASETKRNVYSVMECDYLRERINKFSYFKLFNPESEFYSEFCCDDFVIKFNEYIEMLNSRDVNKDKLRAMYFSGKEEERLAATYDEFKRLKEKGTLLKSKTDL